jgi:hypothetical protein
VCLRIMTLTDGSIQLGARRIKVAECNIAQISGCRSIKSTSKRSTIWRESSPIAPSSIDVACSEKVDFTLGWSHGR